MNFTGEHGEIFVWDHTDNDAQACKTANTLLANCTAANIVTHNCQNLTPTRPI